MARNRSWTTATVVALCSAVLGGCASVGPDDTSSADGLAAAIDLEGASGVACSIVETDLAMAALGTETASHVAGPAELGAGTCNWHSTDPQCFMRSLSTTVRSGGDVDHELDDAVAGAARVSIIDGLGRRAVLSSEDLPVGSAIEIHHLDVLDGDVWVRFTLSGRINRDSSRRLLRDLAVDGLARLA